MLGPVPPMLLITPIPPPLATTTILSSCWSPLVIY
ncbi:hypothetical protein CGRA01v4_09000 [Colletotrichum graminicola]|nr:hypothetical protein CGRA01v4_09000 [Colletotrichum graminicola]